MANVVREDVVRISFEIADNPLSKVTAEMDKLKASVTGAEGGLDKIKAAAKNAAAGVEGIKGAAENIGSIAREADEASGGLKEISNAADGIKNIAKAADKAKEGLGELNQSSEKVKDSGKKFKGVSSSIKEAWSKTKDWAVALKEAAGQKFEKLTSGIKKVSGALGKTVGKWAARGIGAASTAVGAGLAGTVKVGADFDKAMSGVAAISGANSEALAAMTEKAKDMGRTSVFSATEAAEAMNYMAMADWKSEQMIGGIDGIMNLAAASGEDLATTSDIVTDALTAFGMTAADSGRFADVLAAASSNANTNVAMMGETFKYVAPVAGALNYSCEDVAVGIGLMANAGIKSGQAGTAMRAWLSRMTNPTKDVTTAMQKLGLRLTDNKGNMKSFAQIMQDMRKGMSKLSEDDKAMVASMLGGQEAMSGLLAIANASDEDFSKLTESIKNSSGAAKEMADIRLDNLAGDVTLFKSALEGLGIEVSESMDKPLREIVKTGTDMLDDLNKAFEKDGFSGLAKSAGKALGDLIGLGASYAPELINMGIELIKGIGRGIKQSANELVKAFVDVASAAVSGMYEMIVGQPMPEGMFSSIQDAAKNVLDGIVGFASGVRDFIGGILSAAGPLIGGLLNLASGVFAFLGENMNSILPILGIVAGSIMAVVTAQKLSAAAQFVLNASLFACPLTIIVASIFALVAVLIVAYNKSETFRTIIDSLGRIIGWVVGKIGEFISGIVDWVKNCEPLQKILDGIKSVLGWIGDKVGGVFKKAADGLSGFADSLDGGAAEAAGEKVGKGVADGVSKGIKAGMPQAQLSASTLAASAVPGFATIGNTSQFGTAAAGNLAMGITAGTGTVQFAASNMASMAASSMQLDTGAMMMNGQNAAADLASGITASAGAAVAAAGNMASGVETAGQADVAVNLTVDQSGLAAASGAVNSFVAETQTAVGQIPQAFDTAMGTASQTVTAKLTEINTAVTSGMAACLSAVQNGLSQIIAAVSAVNLSSAGANMINGLVNGINSRKAAAVAAARSVATAVNAEFNKVQKISSPSKVWQEKGQFLIEGGIIGMEKTMPQMRDTAQAAGEMSIPYSQNYTPESGGSYSTVNSSSSETNNYSPTFNLTINGGSSSDRDLARRVKEWVREAIVDEFDSMSRKRPAPRLA